MRDLAAEDMREELRGTFDVVDGDGLRGDLRATSCSKHRMLVQPGKMLVPVIFLRMFKLRFTHRWFRRAAVFS